MRKKMEPDLREKSELELYNGRDRYLKYVMSSSVQIVPIIHAMKSHHMTQLQWCTGKCINQISWVGVSKP